MRVRGFGPLPAASDTPICAKSCPLNGLQVATQRQQRPAYELLPLQRIGPCRQLFMTSDICLAVVCSLEQSLPLLNHKPPPLDSPGQYRVVFSLPSSLYHMWQ